MAQHPPTWKHQAKWMNNKWMNNKWMKNILLIKMKLTAKVTSL